MSQKNNHSPALMPADIDWQQDGTPRSGYFDDVYFSSTNGLEETRHVFLEGNHLAQRWRDLPNGAHFIIIETGFGTGLNFLACCELWAASAPADAFLHYVSIEKYPLAHNQIKRTAKAWPQLQTFNDLLADNYPPLQGGIHPLALSDQLSLTLAFGDVTDMLVALRDTPLPKVQQACGFKADAWILDGFTPARNPDMWTPAVFTNIAALSKSGTSFATFTAASEVRKGLVDAGFEVGKTVGFGVKREMLQGRFTTASNAELAPPRGMLAWHASKTPAIKRKQALVIGAGLAGCHTARALANTGWSVDLVDAAPTLAQEASGNPAGILFTRLSAKSSELSDFYANAYGYAARMYPNYFANGSLSTPADGELNGMLQLAYNEKEAQSLQTIAQRYQRDPGFIQWLSPRQCSEHSGIELSMPGLLFVNSGWLKPARVCQALVDHPAITTHFNQRVTALYNTRGNWCLPLDGNESLAAEIAIICAGNGTTRLGGLEHLPLKAVPGQISHLDVSQVPTIPLCHESYLAPDGTGKVVCGASFRLQDQGMDMRCEDHQDNLAKLATNLPEVYSAMAPLKPDEPQGRVAARCTTPDYLPVIGPAPDIAQLLETFAPLAKNAKAYIDASGAWQAGLYVNAGHSTRGLASAALGAALLAALVNGTPRPVSWQIQRAISPARFLIRELIRGKR